MSTLDLHSAILVGVRGVGLLAGINVTSGASNVIFGDTAAQTLTIGDNNVILGPLSDTAAVNTSNAIAVGAQAIAGDLAVAIGQGAQASGGFNVSVGAGSGGVASAGLRNTSIGYNTAYGLLGGADNLVAGTSAAQQLTIGSDNIVLGDTAAPTLVNGSSNVVIGPAADVAAVGTSNAIVIGSAAVASTSGTAIGTATHATHTNAVVLGNGLVSHTVTGTEMRGMRVFYATAANTVAQTFDYPVATAEIVHIEISVTGFDSVAVDRTLFTISDVMAYNVAGTVTIHGGIINTHDPGASGDIATVTASTSNVRLTITKGTVNSTAWVVVWRIMAANLT